MKKDKKQIKELSRSLVFSLITLIIFIGTGFGLYTFHNVDSFTKENQYNIKTSVEVDIVDNYSNLSINQIANDLISRMSWYGYSDGNVYVVDSDTLKVTFSTSYINEDVYLQNSQSPDVPYSTYAFQQASKELVQAYSSLFYTGKVELRSATEELLFVLDDNGNLTFQQPSSGTSSSEASQIYSNTSIDAYSDFDIDSWTEINDLNSLLGLSDQVLPDLIQSANLVYKNGATYIELFPYDYAMQTFRDAWTFLSSNYDPTSNPNGNVITLWIGYDVLTNLIYTIDPEHMTNGSTIDYCLTDSFGNQTSNMKPICQPFLLTYDRVEQAINVNANSILIRSNFGSENAQEVVQRINNSVHDYSFKFKDIKWQTNSRTTTFIKVVLIIYLILILATIFLFGWYLGLLGVLIASSSLITIFSALAIASTSSVVLGSMFFIMLFFALGITIIMSFIFANKIKTNLANKITRKEHLKSLGVLIVRTSVILLIFILPITIFTIPMFDIVRSSMLLLMATIYIGYLVVLTLSLITFLLIFVSYSKVELSKGLDFTKWNLNFGRENYFNNPFQQKYKLNLSDKDKNKITKYSFYVFGSIAFVGLIVFSVLLGVTGSGFNSNIVNNNYYQYDVVRILHDNSSTDSDSKYYLNTFDGSLNTIDDPIIYPQNIDKLNQDQKEVKSIFKQYTNVKNINSNYETRYFTNTTEIPPNLQTPYTPTIETVFEFGYSVYTPKQLSLETLDKINNQLKLVTGVLESNNKTFNYYYQIDYTAFSASSSSSDSIKSLTIKENTKTVSLSLLIIFLVSFFVLLFLLKVSGMNAVILTTTMETLTSIFFLSIIFVPIATNLLLVIPIMISTSIILKVIPIREYINKNRSHVESFTPEDEIYNEVSKIFDKHNKYFKFILLSILTLMLLVIIISGLYGLSSFFFTLMFVFILFVNQTIVLPKIYSRFEATRQFQANKIFTKYYNESTEANYLDEEYIEGINY